MTTYSSRITTGTNDAYDSNDGFPGSQNTSTTIFIGATANGETLTTGFIHEDVNIPAGSTINSATLQVQRNAFDSIGNETLDGIWAKETGTPTTFGTASNSPHDQFEAGGLTTATVAWNMGPDGGDNDPEVSPDLAAIIQEVNDTVGDITDLMLLVRDTATGQNFASIYAFEHATTGRSALLDIDYTEAAGGETVELDGVSAATSTVTGAIVVGWALTGTATATGATTAALSVEWQLTGAAAAAAALTGALSVERAITGTAAASAALTGELGVDIALTGTAAATSTVTGALASDTQLEGAVSASSATTGALSVGRTVTGTVTSTSALTGALTVTSGLTGIVTGTSDLEGELSRKRAVTAIVQAIAALSGEVGVDLALTGTVAAAATLTGTMEAPADMTPTPITGQGSYVAAISGVGRMPSLAGAGSSDVIAGGGKV